MNIIPILILGFFLLFFGKKLGVYIILPLYYLFVVFYTFIGSELYNFAQDVPFGFYFDVDSTSIDRTYFLICFAAISFSSSLLILKKLFGFNYNVTLDIARIEINNNLVLLFFIITIVLLHVGLGVDHLYSRVGYAGATGSSSARILYTLLFPITCLSLPFIKNRILKWTLFLILIFLVQGTSSRNSILIPSLFFVGVCLRDSKVSIVKAIIFGALGLFFAAYSLQYRENQYQGVIPNIIFFINEGVDFNYLTRSVNYVSSFSFYAIALSTQEFGFNLSSFISSISPLPGRFINSDEMMSYQLLNKFAPMPALGFLATSGYFAVFCYYSLISMFWAFSAKLFSNSSKYVSLIIVVLFILFTILSLQYNLRAVTRIIYYAFSIYLLMRLKKLLSRF